MYAPGARGGGPARGAPVRGLTMMIVIVIVIVIVVVIIIIII